MIKRLYLAGGFRGPLYSGMDWQQRVIYSLQDCPEIKIYNPKAKEQNDTNVESDVYVEWDLSAIRKCDTILAYIYKDLLPVGVLAEIGYAKALGKRIILVIEPSNNNIEGHRFNFIKNMADINTYNLADAIKIITLFCYEK